MALAVSKVRRLKPEIRLAQALSEYEAILADDQRAKLRVYRQESAPTAADVMRLTAEIDRDTARTSRSRRCVGPRLCNFLQAVQMFAGVVDMVDGGAQSLIGCQIWGVVKLSLQLTSAVSSYFEHLSALFMSIGRTCPRNQEYLLLYPRSLELKEAVCKYFLVTVQLCKQAVVVSKKPLLGQLFSAMSNTIMSELGSFEQKLDRLASAVTEEVPLASKRLLVQEAEHNSKIRLTSFTTSTVTKKWKSEQMERRFLNACSTYDFQTAWKRIRKQGNVAWFLKEQAYTEWSARTVSSVLHCIGTLGSGKSVLAANVIDELALRDPAVLVVYFFCSYDDLESLSPRVIIGSIAAQIITHLKPDLSNTVSGNQFEVMGTDEVFAALQAILSTNASEAHKLYIVLDGIDECKETDAKVVLKYLNCLTESNNHGFHFFCSSRPDVSNWVSDFHLFNFALSMSTSGCHEEMTRYINDALEASLEERRLFIGNPDILSKTTDVILKNAHGIYLWVALQIDNICSQPTDRAVLKALENIPKDLSETFNRILQKLRNTKENAPFTACSVALFRFVAAARRPLTLDELRAALSIEPGKTAWDPDQLLNDMQKLLNCCGSLLVVDEEDFTVRFVHQSVQQFLCSKLVNEEIKVYEIDLTSADLSLGEICVTYLHSERHMTQLVKREPQLIVSLATLNKSIPNSNLAGKLAIRLLGRREKSKHSIRPALEDVDAITSSHHPVNQALDCFLPYAHGNWLFHTKQLSRRRNPRIWPLWTRLVAGEVHVVRLPWNPENILELGPAFVNYVLRNRQWNLIYVVLACAKAPTIHNLRPIYDALCAVKEKKATSLTAIADEIQLIMCLEPFFAPEHRREWDTRYSSILCAAASFGYVDCVQYVLDQGVDINFQDSISGCTALTVACQFGHETVVKLLLDNGADVNLEGERNGTPLNAACENGQETIVKILLEKGVDINFQSREHRTALSGACRYGHESIVRLLLCNGAEINVEDQKYGTALTTAYVNGKDKTVMIENGANVKIDPLSVVMGVVGLIQASYALTKLLTNLIGSVKDAPAKAAIAVSEISEMRAFFEQIQSFILPFETADKSRTALIQLEVDRLVDVFSECVVTFSEFEAALDKITKSSKTRVGRARRAVWDEEEIDGFVARLKRQKLLLSILVTILNGETQLATWDSIERLNTAAETFWTDYRLGRLQSADNESVISQRTTELQTDLRSETSSSVRVLPNPQYLDSISEMPPRFDFEADLENSRPYRTVSLEGSTSAISITESDVVSDRYNPSPSEFSGGSDLSVVPKNPIGGANINIHGEGHETALIAACRSGRDRIVGLLIDNGADINVPDQEYGTALMIACSNGHEKTVKLLLENGADINFQCEGFDTALIAACRNDREKIVKILLERGADTSHLGEGNDTALIAACRNGCEKIVELLLENSANINLHYEGHDTALIAACRNGREKLVALLLESGANANLNGKEYATPLNTASLDGLEKIVKLLLKSGAEVNLQIGEHGTPLMAASFNGHENVVKLLLENGANVDLEGGMYGSALATAKAEKHSEIEKLLLEHRATENTREQIVCLRSERHAQLVEQKSQLITSSATLRKANASSNLAENLVSIHDPASMGGVVEVFAGMLLKDEDIVKYVEQGFATINSDIFERNLSRFMRCYASELWTEADSRFQKTVSRIAYKYSADVTKIVRRIVVGDSEDGSQDPASDSTKDQTATKLMLGRHMTQEQLTETFEQVYALSEDEHENDEDGYFDVEEPYLRNLGNLTEF